MAILTKGCKLDNFELHNSLSLALQIFETFNLEFCWLWIFPWIKLSWHSSCIWDKPGWLNWFWPFLCEGVSSLNLKGFYYSYAWSSNSEGLLFAQDLSLENSANFCLCFWLALYQSVSYFFPPWITLFVFLHGFWFCFMINHFANVFVRL